MRGILVVGVVMAVVLLLGTGFSGTVYATKSHIDKESKTLNISKPIWIKNVAGEKIISFTAGNTKYILHYKQFDLEKYTVWITGIYKDEKIYTYRYTLDTKDHKAWIEGKEIKIEKDSGNHIYLSMNILSDKVYHKWWDKIYCVYGYPKIKYMHPDRNHYDLGTWENEILSGHSLYHNQIGTDSIGWISELPGALAGAALGAILGEYFGGGPIGAAIGAVIGALLGFITGNVIKRYVCDETGAGWQWINKHDIQEIISALFSPWPWQHYVHIDYYKLGMLGPYSGWVYVPYP